MSVVKQVSDVIFFIILGIIISCIFDVFRALRKIRKKNSIYVVMIQDIIFFVITTIISVIYMITILDDDIRFYMFLAMFLGLGLSRKFISKYLIKFYSIIFLTIKSFIKFLCAPLELVSCIICKLMKKIIKKCCKLFSLMINLKCKLLSVWAKRNNLRRRRGLKFYEKSRYERKKNGKKEKKIS
ncbi:MAG: hypothetical protein J6A15_07355 [Clostridia bacterium]|nr:hypothetical protein [Clostridia bacterium]